MPRNLLPLNWDEILGPGKNGTVLLTAEQISTAAPNVKRVGAQALVQVTDLGLCLERKRRLLFPRVLAPDAPSPRAAPASLCSTKQA